MTPEQINIAIAESVGWQRIMDIWYRPDANSRHITRTSSDGGYTIYPPDYCNDLNAMHEVWCKMTINQHYLFRSYLQTIVFNDQEFGVLPVGPVHSVSNATALQRAEAYLRTIGKWNEKD